MKTTLILMFAGALLGAAIASFVVPPMISWYTTPGGPAQGAVVQIPEIIRYATSKLILGQAIGAVVGAVLGVVVSMAFRKKSRPIAPMPAHTLPTP